MADRTVKVTLTAQAAGYIAGMDQAAGKTRAAGSEMEKLAQKRQAFAGLGTAALAFGAALAAGVGLAVMKFAEFDQAMSNANAILQESTENQQLLRQAALDAGGATVFTARESANAIEELGKTGLTTSHILSGALRGSLDLAAAGQLGVARAGEIVGITLKQFVLDGSEAFRVADVLTAAANKAAGGVEELAQGLKFVGPVAAGMNISLEDTVATIALFADQGIIGEQAGTSLRGMLVSLTSPSKAAQREMENLGITLYDSQGQFLGLENVAGQLQMALSGLTQEERDASLGIIFTNQQITAAQVLVSAGADKWREYRESVQDAGIAQRIAAQRMDNLAGDVEKLGGAFDTFLIQSGSGANEVLRSMVQTLTFLVDAIAGLPAPVLAFGLAMTAAAAVTLLLMGAALRAIPALVDLRTWMASTGLSAGALALRVAAFTAVLAIAAIVVTGFIQQGVKAKSRIDAFKGSLDQATGAVTDYTRELAIARLQEEGAFDAARKAGISHADLTDALLEGGEAWAEVTRRIEEYQRESAAAGGDRIMVTHIGELRGELDAATDAWREQERANRRATVQQERTNDVLAQMEGRASGAREEVDELAKAIRGFGDATLDAREAKRRFQAALDDLSDSIKENGRTLDIGTQKGRENQEALDEIAVTAKEVAAAVLTQTGSTEKAAEAMRKGRKDFIDAAQELGITKDRARELADELGLIPDNIPVAVEATGFDAAQRKIDEFLRKNQGVRIGVGIYANKPITENAAGGVYSGGVQAFAAGGFSSGVYPHTPGGIHKFAEAGDEAYISYRPEFRERNQAITAYSMGRLGMDQWRSAPAAPVVKVVVQPKGGIDILKYVDVRVESASADRVLDLQGGVA